MDDKARSDGRRSSRGAVESVRSGWRSNESGREAKDAEQKGEEKRKVIRKLNKAISSLEKQLKSDTQNGGRDYLLAQQMESCVPELLRAIKNELHKDEIHHGKNDPQYLSASDSALSESLYENSSLTSRAIPSDEKEAGTPVEQSLSRTLAIARLCQRELSHLSLSRERERLQSRVIQNTLASVEDERDEARRKNRNVAARLENTEAKYEKLKASTWKWEEDKIRLRAETENIEMQYRNRVAREEEWMRMWREEESGRLEQRTLERTKQLEEWATRERELLEEMDTMRARHEESLSLLRDTNKTLRDRVNDLELQLDGQKRSFQASSDEWRSEKLKNENNIEKLKEEIKALEVTERSHQSKLEGVQREFEVERERAKEEARSLKATIDKLERDLDLAASAHNTDKKTWEESMEQLRERYSMEGTEERSNYLKEITLLEKEGERLQEENKALIGKQAEFERTATQLTEEKNKLTAELEELITTLQQGKEEREELERRLQEMQQHSEKLQKNIRNLDKDLNATKLSYEEALQQHKNTIADREKEKEEMAFALTKAKEAHDQLEKKFAEESASLTAEWESRLEDLRSEHFSKEEQLKNLYEQEKWSSQNLLRKERAEFDAREKKLIKEKEKVIEQEHEVVKEFMHRLSDKDAEIQSLEEELQKLRSTIEASIEERQSLVGSHREREKNMRSIREDASKYRVLYEKEEVLRKQTEKELERIRKRVKECEHEKTAVEKELEDAENRVLVSEKERINLEKEWFRCNEQLEDGEKEKRRLVKELQRNERRLDEEVKLKAMLQEEISNLKDAIEKKKQERLKLEEEKWKDEIRSTENSQQQMVLQSHLAKLKEEVQDGESTRNRLEDEVRSLKRILETERGNEKKEREAQLAERENVRKSIRLLHLQHCELTERLCMSVEEHFTLREKYFKSKSDGETAERALSHYKIKWQEEKSMKESMEQLYLREKRKKESEERKFDGLNDKMEAEENRFKEREKQLRESLRRSEMKHRDKVLDLEKTLTKVQGERQKLLLRLIEVEHSLEAEKLGSSSKSDEERSGRFRPSTDKEESASASSDWTKDIVGSHSVNDTEAAKAGNTHEGASDEPSTRAEQDMKTLEQTMRTNRSDPGGTHSTMQELTRELQATKEEKERIMTLQQGTEKTLLETQRQKSELVQQVEQLQGVVASCSNLRHVATEYQREHEAYLEKIHKLEEKVQIARGEALEWRRAAEVVELRLHAAIADVAEAEKETDEYKQKCIQQAKMLEETEEAVREVASWTREKDFLVTELDNFRSLAESQEMEISSLKEELRAIRGEMVERVKKTIHAVQDYMLKNKDESLEGENLVQDLSLLEYAESSPMKEVGEDLENTVPIGKKKSKGGLTDTGGSQRDSVPSTKRPTSETLNGRGEVSMLESDPTGNKARSETDSTERRTGEVGSRSARKQLKTTDDGTHSTPLTSNSRAHEITSSVLKSTNSGVKHTYTGIGHNALSRADHEEYRNENDPVVYKNSVNKTAVKSTDTRTTANQKKVRHTTQSTKLKTPSNIMTNLEGGSASNNRHRRTSIVNSRKERTSSMSDGRDRNIKHNSQRVHPDEAFKGIEAAILTENLSYHTVDNQKMPHRRRNRQSRLA